MNPLDSVKQSAADIREYEQTRTSPELTVQELSEIVAGLAARHEHELVEGLKESFALEKQKMKLRQSSKSRTPFDWLLPVVVFAFVIVCIACLFGSCI